MNVISKSMFHYIILFMNGLGPRPHVIDHVISGWGARPVVLHVPQSPGQVCPLFSFFLFLTLPEAQKCDHTVGRCAPICKRPWSPPICAGYASALASTGVYLHSFLFSFSFASTRSKRDLKAKLDILPAHAQPLTSPFRYSSPCSRTFTLLSGKNPLNGGPSGPIGQRAPHATR